MPKCHFLTIHAELNIPFPKNQTQKIYMTPEPWFIEIENFLIL